VKGTNIPIPRQTTSFGILKPKSNLLFCRTKMGEESKKKFFMGGLNYETTEETLKTYFSKWGNVTDCVVMRFPDSKRSR